MHLTSVQYLITFCSQPEADIVGPIVSDKRVKFRDPRLNRSREIQPKAV